MRKALGCIQHQPVPAPRYSTAPPTPNLINFAAAIGLHCCAGVLGAAARYA
jgi:hypothetical protein